MTQSTAGVAEKVRGYRQRIDLDPGVYDGDVDVIMWLVNDTPERTWTPSEVARVVKTVTVDGARSILDMLVRGQHIVADDRGSWTRYWSRRR